MVSLHHVFSEMNDAIFAIDGMRRVVYHNKAFTHIFRRDSSDLLNRHCYEVLCGHTSDGQNFCHPYCPVGTALLRGQAINNFDLTVPHDHGEPVSVNVAGVPAPKVFCNKAAAIFMLRPMVASASPPLSVGNDAPKSQLPDELAPTLTRRERQILCRLAEGASARALADELHINYVTVRNHIQHMYVKLGVHNRAEAVSYAHRHDLLR